MKVFVLIGILLAMNILAAAQITAENYRVYDAQGNPSGVDKIVVALKDADVLFLGENHDDAAAHFLQAEIFRKAVENYGRNRQIALSLEMFERDTQTILNEYLSGFITEQQFLNASRPWENYKGDYRPLVEFAKSNKLAVIAANAPRRYVNMVTRLGRDSLASLSPEAKNWLAPLPYGEASDAYAKKFNDLMGQMNDSITSAKHSPMVNAQSLWDATMAFSIAEYLKRAKNPLVVQLNGGFHSENRLGVPEHLLKYAPKSKFVVVTMRAENDFQTFDKAKHSALGDFVILTDAKIPRSYGAKAK